MIAEQCNLGCHLTYYMSRHSFATLICLNNGVPIETISKMMGHSSIRTTQIYAEITNQKVSVTWLCYPRPPKASFPCLKTGCHRVYSNAAITAAGKRNVNGI